MDALLKSGNYPKPGSHKAELEKLESKAEQLALDAKSTATKRAYKRDCESFARWTTDKGLLAMPAEIRTIILYITHLDELGRAPSTITRALTAISQVHKLSGIDSPTASAQVGEVLKGIRRQRGTAPNQARPLLARGLKKILKIIPPDVLGKRDKALLLVGWAGALRRSELVGLDYEDLLPVEEGVVLTIRKSKGDQEAKGQKVAIPSLENEFCPVKALFEWRSIVARGSGPVFCAIGYGGKNNFFVPAPNPRRLGEQSVSLIVKKYIKAIGENPAHYSAHSLRAGWTTSAAAIGTPDHLLMKHTRHRNQKDMAGYIRDGQLFNDNPLPLLLCV